MASVKLVTQSLITELIHHITASDTIYLLVSFVMDSGVQMLVPHLREAANRGADIKILTGDYLYVTEPDALSTLCSIDGRIEGRLWKSNGIAFHPKAYLFQSEADSKVNVLFVGSSNLSKSAMTSGVEWNLSIGSEASNDVFSEAEHLFMEMFYHDRTVALNPESIKQYRADYDAYHLLHPNWTMEWSQLEQEGRVIEGLPDGCVVVDSKTDYRFQIEARPVQVEALEQLRQAREDGYDKAMVVMATGLGKTYLAAMFATHFRRILFLAHRQEILMQAQHAFKTVMPSRSCGLYYGQQKDDSAECIFASIFTLGMKHHRVRFAPEDFDLVIVDEFHHAAAQSYQT